MNQAQPDGDDAAALGRVPGRSGAGRSAAEEGRAAPTSSTATARARWPKRSGWPTPDWSGCSSRPAPTPTCANEDGQTALMLAARTGNVAVAKLLVEHGADVNRREQFTRPVGGDVGGGRGPRGDGRVPRVEGRRPVGSRARPTTGTTQISSEPRVQYRPTGGLTPLLYAARAGCLGCVTAMLDAGADVDRPNPDGMTPMMMALDNGYPDVARYLLDHGANPHTWDWWGRTPLYVAVTMRGGRDSRAGTAAAGVAGVHQGAARCRRESERAARLQGTEPRRTRQSLRGRSAHDRAPRRSFARRRPSTTTSSGRCSRTARWSICRTRPA